MVCHVARAIGEEPSCSFSDLALLPRVLGGSGDREEPSLAKCPCSPPPSDRAEEWEETDRAREEEEDSGREEEGAGHRPPE